MKSRIGAEAICSRCAIAAFPEGLMEAHNDWNFIGLKDVRAWAPSAPTCDSIIVVYKLADRRKMRVNISN